MAQHPLLEGVTWTYHAGFRIDRDGKVIYLDPWRLSTTIATADVVFITHPHFDHFDLSDLQKVVGPNTKLVMPPDCEYSGPGQVIHAQPGQSLTVEGIQVQVIHAYNINKEYHPREKNWLGYVLTVGGVTFLHPGDTDDTPELRAVSNIHVAFVPVSGTYVMTASEAAAAMNAIQPQVAVPMHWGAIIGSRADAEQFRDLFNGTTVILDPADGQTA